jgi:catechol 2,3-dioxygenase-like lactoylglutathione lyase family enzyme
MTAPLHLDHLGILVADLEAARRVYEGLGFRLTPRSSHQGRITPDGPVEVWGTGNHCAMFRQGYVELLGITDLTLHHDHVKARLQRYGGLQLVALGCNNADDVRGRWMAAIDAQLRPVAEIARAVPQHEGGEQSATFRIVYLDGHFPEAELFAIEHRNRDVLWQPPLLDHPNGVVGLVGVTLVSPQPAAALSRLAALGLLKIGSQRAELSNGSTIEVVTPEQAARQFPGEVLPAVPCAIAATYAVGNLDTTAHFLAASGISTSDGHASIRVSARDAQGCVIEFVEDTGAPVDERVAA